MSDITEVLVKRKLLLWPNISDILNLFPRVKQRCTCETDLESLLVKQKMVKPKTEFGPTKKFTRFGCVRWLLTLGHWPSFVAIILGIQDLPVTGGPVTAEDRLVRLGRVYRLLS